MFDGREKWAEGEGHSYLWKDFVINGRVLVGDERGRDFKSLKICQFWSLAKVSYFSDKVVIFQANSFLSFSPSFTEQKPFIPNIMRSVSHSGYQLLNSFLFSLIPTAEHHVIFLIDLTVYSSFLLYFGENNVANKVY